MDLKFSLFRSIKLSIIVMAMLLSVVLSGCSNILLDTELLTGTNEIAANNEAAVGNNSNAGETNKQDSSLTSFDEVAAYIREYSQLPSNFITKKEAEALGWVASQGNLHEVAPGMSIGGDRFGNREGLLPKSNGRVWYEADINYEGGRRNADRIVFSNDGLIYMTTDHYKSFTNITKEEA